MYYKQLHANKLDNQEGMDKLLEMNSLSRTETRSRLITNNEIKSVIKKIPTNKSPCPSDFIGEFCQSFQEEFMPILLKLFQKLGKGRRLPSSFYEVCISLIPKPKTLQKKKMTGQYP